MTIKTTQVTAIDAAELARANALEVQATQAVTQLANQASTITGLQARVAQLEAQVAQPPVVVPPVVTPPTGARPRAYLDGGKVLKTKSGNAFTIRGIEVSYDNDCVTLGPVGVCKLVKALGGNTISPLFSDGNGDLSKVKAICDAALAEGLFVLVNADHQETEGGREWLCAPGMVTLLNGYSHVGLECEIETPEVSTNAQWVAGAKSLLNAVRAAGHKSILKVGAPQGGRRVEFPLQAGAEVFAADPEKATVFTTQLYWGQTGSWYQGQAGVTNGLAGSKQALQMIAASPLCFVLGFDWEDDGGTTGELELITEAHRLGLHYQHWELSKDGTLPGNNMLDRFDWRMLLSSITPNGIALQTKMLAGRQMAVGL